MRLDREYSENYFSFCAVVFRDSNYLFNMELNRWQKAAKISNDRRHEKSIKDYLDNPNICLHCGGEILPKGKQKIREIKRQKFCSRSCSAIYHNNIRYKDKPKKEKVRKVRVHKKEKNPFNYLSDVTKQGLIDKSGVYYKFRACVRKQSHYLYKLLNKDVKCVSCGYSKHIEVCHIKSVSEFSGDSLIAEINDINNLIGLCPNCHWEFDNGLLDLNDIKKEI